MAEPIWYYAVNDQEHGPVTAAELKQAARSGQLRPHDLVWKQGLDDWKPARYVAGLFPAVKESTPQADNENGRQREAEQIAAAVPLETPDFSEVAAAGVDLASAESAPPTEAEEPPEALVNDLPDSSAEPSPTGQWPAAESAPAARLGVHEPPPPPPIGAPAPVGVAVSGEYRPQERVNRGGLTVGPVTLRIARGAVAVGLLLIVALAGCESLSSSYAARLSSLRQSAEQDFLRQSNARRATLQQERDALQDMAIRSSVQSMNLGRILDDLESFEADLAAERARLANTQWAAMTADANLAAAAHVQRLWWLRLARAPLLVLLTGGALVLAIYSNHHERWLGLGLAAIVAAAVLM